ncbi:tetraspanin-1-like [Acipenser oxyrinchus oxyrinchus]|uniref:Tetraspanin n=1 Tax=Acipenser oxyrinchus oxyrinchus TaxID=40147 RepID=A0AAD8CLU2_ACIOX|nr:tetraspanin-1-like [Acipenser oxyrinchus oxyrinchus]
MAELNNLYACFKYLMMFFSAIIFIAGGVLFGLGLWIKYGTGSFIQAIGSFSTQFINIGYICIGVGSVLVVIGLIGCCGAWKENRCLLLLFFCIVSIIYITEVVGAVLIFIYKDIVESVVRNTSRVSLIHAYAGPVATDTISQAWNLIMLKYQCCGFDNYTDFTGSQFSNSTGLSYPKTCCVNLKEPACDGKNTANTIIHEKVGTMIVSAVLFVRIGQPRNED